MGYDIGWAIVGEQALGKDELEALRAHVAKWSKRIVGYELFVATSSQVTVQAHCHLRPERAPDDDVDEDEYGDGAGGYALDVIDKVFDALTKMREIVPRHEVLAQDDFFGYRWNGRGFDTAKVEVDWPGWDEKNWIAISELSAADVQERFADRPIVGKEKRVAKPRAAKPIDPNDPEASWKARHGRSTPWATGPTKWTSRGGYREIFIGPWDLPPEVSPERPYFEQLDEAQANAIAHRADETSAPAAPAPAAVRPASETVSLITELLEIARSERTDISADERARFGLHLSMSPSRYDVCDEVARVLAASWPEETTRLMLDHAETWMRDLRMQDVAKVVFVNALGSPELCARAIDLWHRSLTDENLVRDVVDYLRGFLSVLAGPAIEVLRAPLPSLERDVGVQALRVLGRGKTPDALSVIVACIRRDRRDPRWPRWSEEALDALERLEDPRAFASTMLECIDGDQRSRLPYRILARDSERGIAVLDRMLDAAGLADYAVDLLDTIRFRVSGENRARELLAHPFFQIRIWAANRVHYGVRDLAASLVLASLEGEEVEIREEDLRRLTESAERMRRDGMPDERYGIEGPLPRLPSAVAGLASRCSDHRTWAMRHVDRRGHLGDAAALVLADELDLELSHRGHARTAVVWSRWRGAFGDVDAAGRGAWARSHLDGVPAELRAVADRGAKAVAADYPSGRLVLSDAERDSLDRLEQDLARRGEQLLGITR